MNLLMNHYHIKQFLWLHDSITFDREDTTKHVCLSPLDYGFGNIFCAAVQDESDFISASSKMSRYEKKNDGHALWLFFLVIAESLLHEKIK